jgi:hypothetical protein
MLEQVIPSQVAGGVFLTSMRVNDPGLYEHAVRPPYTSPESFSLDPEPAMPFDAAKLPADTEAFCQELRPHEELCYAEHTFNDQLVPLAKKYNLLGINMKPELGPRVVAPRSSRCYRYRYTSGLSAVNRIPYSVTDS